MDNYFNEHGHMAPWGENGILFTAEYFKLKEMVYGEKPDNTMVLIAIENVMKSIGSEPLSHDNMTGIVCLSIQSEMPYHTEYTLFPDWTRRLHPRDISFYAINQELKSIKIIGYLLFPILFFSQLWACWHKQQTQEVLDTDGKLLAWLRIETLNMRFSRFLCKKILKYRHNMTWYDIFKIYFRDENHPNVKMARSLYEQER